MYCYKINFARYFKFVVNCSNGRLNDKLNFSSISALNKNSNKCILNYDDFSTLAVDKPSEALIKLIICEYNYYRHRYADNLPDNISLNDMKHLMNCWKCNRRQNVFLINDNSHFERLKLLSKFADYQSFDGSNQLFLPFNVFHNSKHKRNRLRLASLFGQNVVIDVSFDKHMSRLECKNCAEQLKRIFHFNYRRITKRVLPFNLNIVNCDHNGWTKHYINTLCPELNDPQNYCNITKQSYLDLFDVESLVYLSPDAEQVLSQFDHNVCYIFGGIVDRRNTIPLTFNKSKTENIRSMRLPIDNYLKYRNIQSIDNAFYFLHDLKESSLLNKQISYDSMLRSRLPKRKLKSCGQIACEQLIKEGSDLNCDFEDNKKLMLYDMAVV